MSRKAKNRTQTQIILLILLAIMVGVAGFSTYKIITITNEYHEEEQKHQQLIDDVVINHEPQGGAQLDDDDPYSIYLDIDHKKLRGINSDYIGWVNIPETNISHPIVQTNSNQYYVHVGFDGHYSANGTIFEDYRLPNGLDNFNIILYGHLRNNKTMFWYVSQFKNKDYYYGHQQVEIYRDGQVEIYKPFAFFKTKSNSKVYSTSLSTNQEKDEYIQYLISNSWYTPENTVTNSDKILILSTCTDASSDNRWVLCCVKTDLILLEKRGLQ